MDSIWELPIFFIAGIYFIATLLLVKLVVNPIKRFFTGFGKSNATFTVDGVGYRNIGKRHLEVAPEKYMETIEGDSMGPEANKYRMKYVPREAKAYIEIPENINNRSIVSIGKEGLKGYTNTFYIKIPPTVCRIKDEAFSGCSNLIDITIPPSVKSIGSRVFEDCLALEKVSFGKKVRKIGSCAFTHCINLREIHCQGAPFKVGIYTFNKVLTKHCTLYVPDKYLEQYKKSADWNMFSRIEAEGRG